MANIARGQITIVDLNDGKSVNLFISSSKPATQIYDKDTKAYTPNYTVSPFNVLTPEVFVSGETANQATVAGRVKNVVWKINDAAVTTAWGSVATAAPYALTINKNLISVTQCKIECQITYVDPDTTAETIAKATFTITKAENAGQQIRAIAYAPNGTTFKNGDIASLTAVCEMWRGSSVDATDVSYQWYKLVSGTWTAITSANAVSLGGFTGYTTKTLTIPAAAVLNFENFKCEVKDTDSGSATYNKTVADYISFADMTDPYMVDIVAPTGTTLKAGVTSTELTVNVWQNGSLKPDSWFKEGDATNGAVCTWRKYSKAGVLDSAWGTSGTKTGRKLTVTRDEVSVAATFQVEISK